ncbi:interferon-induced protein 44-like isoform X2 [Colossoma macropomum]|uniref:interferon-induced protein 44-like isoform X2 n=1 Tax=Colossoma macropomum TaxID=42526 RepID=UPI001865363D|nr:interferon-induced protein 44-like isoform X2 [Colossoma macropomum]
MATSSTELSVPWRPVTWSLEVLRILLHGPTGAGKSCFINSVQRILLGRNAIGALEQTARTGASFTRMIKTHRLKRSGGGRYPFVFCDIMGLEPEDAGGIQTEDIISVLEGRISDGYTFNPLSPITADSPKYNRYPHPCHKVHCLVSILPADSIARMSDKVIDKMKTIRQKAAQMGMPQVVIMTKVDEACELVNRDLRKVYQSKKIKEKVQECSNKLGIPLNCIYPVKNYHAEITQDADVDVLILMALRDILNFANDYVEDLYE